MKSKVLLFLLCLSLSSGLVLAQFQSFDLSSYINPFYKRSSLNFNLGLNGQNNWDDINSNGPFRSSNSFLGGNFQGNFYHVLNSVKVQRSRQIVLFENSNLQKGKGLQGSSYWDSKSNINALNLNIITSDRFYHGNLHFFEITFNGAIANTISTSQNYLYNQSPDTLQNGQKDKNNYGSLNGAVGIRYGKGRLESIEDARLAVYILEDLTKHNRLSRVPTNEEILAFSKVITQIKNKRFLDARIRKIEEITAVDSFLNASNLITTHDAAYFTTVNDNWDNAAGPLRTAGFRYSIGISPNIDWETYKSKSEYIGQSTSGDTSKRHRVGADADLQFDYNKPLNLYWQLDGALNLKYSLWRDVYESSYMDNISKLSASLSGKIGYYPNSRSYYSGVVTLICAKTFENLLNTSSPIEKGNYLYVMPQFSLNAYYYISQHLRLSGTYNIIYNSYNYHDDYLGYTSLSDTKGVRQSFLIALSYSIF